MLDMRDFLEHSQLKSHGLMGSKRPIDCDPLEPFDEHPMFENYEFDQQIARATERHLEATRALLKHNKASIDLLQMQGISKKLDLDPSPFEPQMQRLIEAGVAPSGDPLHVPTAIAVAGGIPDNEIQKLMDMVTMIKPTLKAETPQQTADRYRLEIAEQRRLKNSAPVKTVAKNNDISPEWLRKIRKNYPPQTNCDRSCDTEQ